MRVLIVNYEYPPVGGGAATAAEGIAKALIQLGHRVVVMTGRFKDQAKSCQENGVDIHRIPSLRRAIDRCSMWEMMSFLCAGLIFGPAIIKKYRIEAAIVFFSLPCGPIGFLGRRLYGVPYVVSLRGGDVPGAEPSLRWIHSLLRPIRRAVLKNSVAVVANSEGLRKMAEAADPLQVQLIPNGVDTIRFVPPPLKPARNENVLRILFVGRFQNQKNLPFLLKQVAKLQPSTFELHLVGDGPLRKSLRDLANELGIAESTAWHGWVSRAALRDLYQWADCLVNPSLYEGMSNVVLEAMASGLPVVASNVPGNRSLVVDGQTGFLIELDHPSGAVPALTQLYDTNTRLRLGENARRRVVQFFSWETGASQYIELLSGRGLSTNRTSVSVIELKEEKRRNWR